MRGTTTPGDEAPPSGTLPVLDWSRFGDDPSGTARALGEAFRGPGFVLLTGHGIDPAPAFEAADRLFALSAEEKARLDIRSTPHNRGYAAQGVERLDPDAGPDAKESFNIGLEVAPGDPRMGEPFRGPNLWPDLPGFREALLAYWDGALALGRSLMRAVALDLGLPEDRFAGDFRAPMAVLRLLRYPGGGDGLGAGAHTDYGALTLLATDGEPGLELRRRGGGWTPVPDVPGALVVNIGDALARWTNGTYVSTPHRVRAPRRERRSVAFFLDPDPGAVLAALPGTGEPRHAPITAAEHLAARLEATYG